MPYSLENNRLFLKFPGVNTVANVFINGKHIGEHRGGYTAFTFEITDFVNQESFKENGRQQLKEMIYQQYNHPSICLWGLFNELKEDGDNLVDYVRELNALTKKIDPPRITTAASNRSGELNKITDIVSWNLYFGWYGGMPEDVGNWADETHKDFPETPIGISEYGAGTSIYHQQEELKKPDGNSYWHPENWQTHFHEQ